ncbi:MAG: hypothetical protein JWO46_320 [Nocardioidaceae bacterium]|nr:hypothetical protein [Nocardioidaceae bacterium]
MTGVRASVLIPTHDHHATLPFAVRSVLAQEVTDLEVIVIGDGVDTATRAAALALVADDDRVRFLDLSKGAHHGEVHRDTAVRAARSEAILYLCDDDLLLPGHVGDLLDLLAGADLVQSLNGEVGTTGELRLHPADLADDETVRWLVHGPRYNQVSLTGTGHTRAAYLALETGWETTPAGEWPDHFMWKKFFRVSGFRGATSTRMTALQFPTSDGDRDIWSADRRAAEIAPWAAWVSESTAQARVDDLVAVASRRELDRLSRQESADAAELHALRTEIHRLNLQHVATAGDVAELLEHAHELDRRRRQLRRRNRRLQRELALARRSWSRKVADRVRAVRRHG